MPYTILKTMDGTLYGEKVKINQCFVPSYGAKKQGQNIFYTIDNSALMPADSFWYNVNKGNIKIKG